MDLPPEIWQTYLSTMVRKKRDVQNPTTMMMGFPFRYSSFPSLCESFIEIFQQRAYHFTTPNPEPFIVDCGSNIGLSVLYFKLLCPQAEILAFEPDTDAFQCLASNVSALGDHGITIKEEALAKGAGSG